MRTVRTAQSLAVPLRALRLLVLDFPDLPAPTVGLTPIYPERLELSLHDDLGSFEPWRNALSIGRGEVDFHTQGDGETWVLQASIDYAGATVRLTAYGAALEAIRPGGGGDGRPPGPLGGAA
ncbi:hypothetical protein ABZ819_13490 [Streptomyces venezuelae]|uniref:hypothetical protein n=1 Tax=Streptomyces venezuelae TaxID=54571 RepID=UPI0034241A91